MSTPVLVNERTANLTIDGVRLGVTRSGRDLEMRTRYLWQVTGPGWVEGGDDLRTGVRMDDGPVAMLRTMLSFLCAAMESWPDGENAGLFPPAVVQWALEHDAEVTEAAYGEGWS